MTTREPTNFTVESANARRARENPREPMDMATAANSRPQVPLPVVPITSSVNGETMRVEGDVVDGRGVLRIVVQDAAGERSIEINPEHLIEFRNLRQRTLLPLWRAGVLRSDWVLNAWAGGGYG